MISCPFCESLGAPPSSEVVFAGNRYAAALKDRFPVSDGHSLVLPRRHVQSIFELGGEEQQDVWNLVAEVREKLKTSLELPPDGFNVGPNDGEEAGQTVLHAHIHVIPRFKNDVPDPRGGIRWVLPRKANYWEPAKANPFQQVEFLGFIQSIFEHGGFVSTYKFALLQALADLCLELDPENDGTTRIPLPRIAEKFIGYYWKQAAPFHLANGEMVVLRQNQGPRNVAIVRLVEDVRSRFPTIHQAKSAPREWRGLVGAVARQIKEMPLFKLQTVGRNQLEMLYPNQVFDGCIILNKGIQDCFRQFYGIVVRLCRREWLDMVHELNPGSIGAPLDLAEFLFGSDRTIWLALRPVLREIQGGRCFYCQRTMTQGAEDLDHFIPWSLYPNDLAHNFVLSCRGCNNSKGDELADDEALQRWLERNQEHGHKLSDIAASIGIPADLNASLRIAAWAYEHARRQRENER